MIPRSIKHRLLIGQLTLCGFALLAASIGLFYASLLNNEINYLTDRATPVLETSDDMIAVMWEHVAVLEEGVAADTPDLLEAQRAAMLTLSRTFAAAHETLMPLLDDEYRGSGEQAKQQYESVLAKSQRLLDTRLDEMRFARLGQEHLDRFDAVGAELVAMLDEFAFENEQEMQSAEDRADEIVASSEATAEDVNRVLEELFETEYPAVEAALKMQRLVIEIQDTSGEYLSAQSDDRLATAEADFRRLTESADEHLDTLERLTETEEDKQDFLALDSLYHRWTTTADDEDLLFDTHLDRLAAESLVDELSEQVDDLAFGLDETLERIAYAADTIVSQADEAAQASYNEARLGLVAASVLCLVAGVLTTFFLSKTIVGPLGRLVRRVEEITSNRDLSQRLDSSKKDEIGRLSESFDEFLACVQGVILEVRDVAEDVAAKSSEVAVSSTKISATMGQQSDQVTRVSSAMEEMSGSISEVARRSADAANSADESGRIAAHGGDVVKETVTGMARIHEAVASSAASVEELSKRSEQIGEVITVINEIADQTNLLALNAAIEAARAGEHGRGFAVVADEVRKLADRTTRATDEIADSIQAIQQETTAAVEKMGAGTHEVDTGVDKAEQAGDALKEIVASARDVSTMIQSIASAAQQQSVASDEASQSITKIASGTQESADQASEVEAAAHSLSERAENVRSLVQQFRVKASEAPALDRRPS